MQSQLEGNFLEGLLQSQQALLLETEHTVCRHDQVIMNYFEDLMRKGANL